MSQENVEVIKRAFAEFEQGNFWLPDFFDAGIRIRWLDAVGTETETVGLQAMSDFMRNWVEVWKRVTLRAERIFDAGDEVVVSAVWRGQGEASGAATEWPHGQVWTLHDGKATSVIAYPETSEALEAVGLRE